MVHVFAKYFSDLKSATNSAFFVIHIFIHFLHLPLYIMRIFYVTRAPPPKKKIGWTYNPSPLNFERGLNVQGRNIVGVTICAGRIVSGSMRVGT